MLKESYNIKLNNFEGPMDLLLYFIKRDRIDIYDIPILQITNKYFDYINAMKLLDIDLGAEFVYMSTLLLQIKARMLLPRLINEVTEDLEDPRAELVHRLLEYKRYKNASNKLEDCYKAHLGRFPKGMTMNYKQSNDISLIAPTDIKLYDLAKTFKLIIESLPENNKIDIQMEQISLQDQIKYIKDAMSRKKEISIKDLITRKMSRLYVIGLFLAILEMIKTSKINFNQSTNFSDIKLYWVN